MTAPATIRAAIDFLGGCEAAGEATGYNPRTVRRWYSGARPPGETSLASIEMALRVRAMSMVATANELRETEP